jgi:hypothetical protein
MWFWRFPIFKIEPQSLKIWKKFQDEKVEDFPQISNGISFV